MLCNMNSLEANHRRWLVTACVSLGLFASALDTTVNVALPTIGDAFNTDISSLQWVIIAFVTTSTALGVSMGSASDRFGLARFFRLGLFSYVVAMLLLGLAPNLIILISIRVLQGVASAAVLSVGPAIVGLSFSMTDRGRALGIMGGTQAMGTVVAGFAGGLLVDAFGWPIIFLGRIPFLIIALVLALLILRDEPKQSMSDQTESHFDIAGAITLSIAIASLLIGLNLVQSTGASATLAKVLLLTSVIGISAFIYVESRAPWPVLELSLFRRRPFTASFMSLLLNSLGAFTIWFVFPFFVADVLEVGPTTLGFLLGLLGLCAAIASPIGGWMADRLPAQRLVTAANTIVVLALFWISTLNAHSQMFEVAIPLALTGMGQGTLRAAARTLVFSGVPQERFGTASGALNLAGSMGVVLSVAAFTAFFANARDGHTERLVADGLSAIAAAKPAHVEAFQETFGLGALVAATGVVASLLAWGPGEVSSKEPV